MKKIITAILLAIIINNGIIELHADEKELTRELYYTYIGPIIGAGFNNITVNDWFVDKTGTKKVTGNYYSGGAVIKVYIKNIEGDFSIQYYYNANSDYNIRHLYYSMAARYLLNISELLAFSSGPGIYFESPPSNKTYDGSAGFFIPLGIQYQINFEIKLLFDVKVSYGSFGIGENSNKLSYGVELGAIYKVGRL